jgi:chorismate mutase/prephenate dehydratase
MAKRSTSGKKAAPSSRKPKGSLEGLRDEIDAIDREILQRLNSRARLSLKIGRLKESIGHTAYSPTREKEILDRLISRNRGPLLRRCVRAVFREILSGTRSLIAPLKVAYLGPMYSYSHLAATEQFGQSAELVPVATIAAVFEEVNHGQSDFGLVPLENSTDGRIADTLEMFVRMPARICGEVQLRIHHNLLGRCQRADVKEVYSKPQALSQCRQWLARHLPSAQTVEIASTTAAAQLAAEKDGVAAIASLPAASNYGLSVIAGNIEDNPENITRFAMIGEQSSPPTESDKTSVMFQVAHQPGALAEALNIFKRNKLNMTWIESFPLPGASAEYQFFVELEGHETSEVLKRAIKALDGTSLRLVVLGSYPKAEPLD